ncbi:MAG: LON peptidase substrate-binding domain-containing protein [Siphonobacter sp.]
MDLYYSEMTFLPLFPLNLVAYPGEQLNLHIFEPRYRQLITECEQEKRTFGIPTYLHDRLTSYGTEMRIVEIHRRYEDGRMDISTLGLRVFYTKSVTNPVTDKLYAGGEVEFLENEPLAQIMPGLLERLKRLYQLLQTPFTFNLQQPHFSFYIAHKVGLSLEREYELLRLTSETERQVFLIRHLEEVLPVIAEMERTKERIRLNGHFKNLDPLNY